MFSLKLYLEGNRESPRGGRVRCFLFVGLVVGATFWNPGLQITPSLPWQRKAKLAGTTGRQGNTARLVFLSPLWLPLITHLQILLHLLGMEESPRALSLSLLFCVLYSFTDYIIHWQSFNFPLSAGPTISGSSQDPSLSPGSEYGVGCAVATPVPLWMHMCPLWMHLFFPKAFSKLENSVSLFLLLLHAQPMWVAVLLLWSWTELGPNPSLCFQMCKIAIYKYITHKVIVRTEWSSDDEILDTSQGQNRPQ